MNFNRNLKSDVVSFSGKKYDAQDIKEPTNHCGYCGCKVYTAYQIDSIAKEMMNSKSERLQGKIKSILEKLEYAKHSDEMTMAKRIENREEIEFFKSLLDISSKKPFLKGDAIFEQMYQQNSEDAIKILTKNMSPLLKTIDHISPQNREEENNNADINLIEACYCCNHDIKKGISFNEFYTMFPSIKKNMPADKFKYASSNILLNGQTGIEQRLSANNIIKSLQRLFLQRNEAINNLNSINYKISGLHSQIDDTINLIQTDISSKKLQVTELKSRLDVIKNDDEFAALQQRNILKKSLLNIESTLDNLYERRSNLGYSINELQNPRKKNKTEKKREKTGKTDKRKKEESQETKQNKIKELKQKLEINNASIKELELKKLDIEIKIEELNKKFPSIEMLQDKKHQFENILNIYAALEKEKIKLSVNKNKKADLELKIDELEKQIKENPFEKEQFEITSYSQEEQTLCKRYQNVIEALSYIDKHHNGGDINVIIRQSAKKPLQEELQQLENMPVIIDLHNSEQKSILQTELKKYLKELENINNEIKSTEKLYLSLSRKADEMPKETAQIKLDETINDLNRLSAKQNELEIPKKIEALEAEILMMEQSIQELLKQKNSVSDLSVIC